MERPLAEFVIEKLKAEEGWTTTQVEFNGVLVGGVIVVSGERAFERMVAHIKSSIKLPDAPKPVAELQPTEEGV